MYPIPQWFINKYNRRYPKKYLTVEKYIESKLDSTTLSDVTRQDIYNKSLLHKRFFIPIYMVKVSADDVEKLLLGLPYIVQNIGNIPSWDKYYCNVLEDNPLIYLDNSDELVEIANYHIISKANPPTLKKMILELQKKYSIAISEFSDIFQRVDDEHYERIDNAWFEYNMERTRRFENKHPKKK